MLYVSIVILMLTTIGFFYAKKWARRHLEEACVDSLYKIAETEQYFNQYVLGNQHLMAPGSSEKIDVLMEKLKERKIVILETIISAKLDIDIHILDSNGKVRKTTAEDALKALKSEVKKNKPQLTLIKNDIKEDNEEV